MILHEYHYQLVPHVYFSFSYYTISVICPINFVARALNYVFINKSFDSKEGTRPWLPFVSLDIRSYENIFIGAEQVQGKAECMILAQITKRKR